MLLKIISIYLPGVPVGPGVDVAKLCTEELGVGELLIVLLGIGASPVVLKVSINMIQVSELSTRDAVYVYGIPDVSPVNDMLTE